MGLARSCTQATKPSKTQPPQQRAAFQSGWSTDTALLALAALLCCLLFLKTVTPVTVLFSQVKQRIYRETGGFDAAERRTALVNI